MTVPNTLANFTQMLRTEVERADMTSWRSLLKNSVAHVENMRAYLKLTPLIDEACSTAVVRCQEYAKAIGDRGILYSPKEPATEQARQLALISIDELEDRLKDAKPSDHANMLALGW
jgi:hypothetical protein